MGIENRRRVRMLGSLMDTLPWKAESGTYALERRKRGRIGPLETQKLVVRSVEVTVGHGSSLTRQESGNATD